ncbi:hypothetical protein VV089_10785 [Candidatus Merdisoma sp. JLR.KK011]|uniref:hypothetical protein n=1 Tax=Candidatus Merdisoma sp. JLR.KK011 TaxID=3114299 RepID=UPI002FEF0245
MNLEEVYVDARLDSGRNYPYGEFLLDCGIKIRGIHIQPKSNIIYVNYPSVRDKKGDFHPSFCIPDSFSNRAIKNILIAAWQRAKDDVKRFIYGYRKVNCTKEIQEISANDFEWTNEKRECEASFSNLRQMLVRAELVMDKKNTFRFRQAFAKIYFARDFVIKNVRILADSADNFTVQFPQQRREETVTFLSEEDSSWVKSCLIEQFQSKSGDFRVIKEENITDEEYLFQVLWSASENGYILQSRIRQILEQNQIDWKNIYHVDKISKLIEKSPFMSVRQLEPTPEHYVKWVVISYEKDPEPVIIKNDSNNLLTDEVKEELHDILTDLYEQNGKVDLSTIIPYLKEKYLQTFQKLPKIKLKAILQSCDFIRFEGGPNPPVYVHVLDAVSKTGYIAEGPKIENGIKKQEIVSETFHKTISDEENPVENVSENLLAKNNPFSLRKNTKLVLEQSIPDSKLPKITTEQSMKNYLLMSTLGHLDSMDLEILYWISNLQYAKSTFLYDLIMGGFIEIPAGKNFSKDKLSTRLMRLYKIKFINFYKLCSVDEKGIITNKSNHRVLMITAYGRTQLRAIGRKSNYEFFMALDNIEKILNKLSVNQWFTKYVTVFKSTFYYLDTIVVAKIAEANAARIPLVINLNGVPVFVKAYKRGNLYNQDVRSGEFAFWLQRVSNLLENYSKLYINSQYVEFRKKPKLVFVCEDLEHCEEVYQNFLNIVSEMENQMLKQNLWFAQDLDIYNDFLHAHFRFDMEGKRVPEAIDEFLEVKITGYLGEEPEDANEQSTDEDERILEELEYEERQMTLLMEE